ncbi:uncharacterized protein LOC117172044 [Belonocnema kinseyi]|uniref:uncharacterized protein LOC117172044 n=1 Tax=Belonocnema kinseyi TaxID=2817044 RepID=UPI00143DF734|nr:uncharacterized protein LOC117172044 [Belonocnema kinseyi]
MKILISNLLSAIAFLVQFGELNASGLRFELSTRLTPKVVPRSRNPQQIVRAPDERILHGDTFISLWLDPQNRRTVLKADHGMNISPGDAFVSGNDFYMKLTEIGDAQGNFTVVGYFWPSRVLFGVRAPCPARSTVLEPNSSQWFILHYGRGYRVKTNRRTGEVEYVTLLPRNVHEKPENQHGLQRQRFGMNGVHFWIYYEQEKGVLGAEYIPPSP